MSSSSKIALVCVLIASSIALLMVYVNHLNVASFKSYINAMGYWAPVCFVAIFTATTALGAPTSIFSAIGGALFGGAIGTTLAVASVTLGASASFLFTRHYAKEFVAQKLGGRPWFIKLNDGLGKSGLYFIIFARVVPVFPFNGTNFAAGVTRVSFRDYFFGTLLGVIPANIIFANTASRVIETFSGEGWDTGAVLWLSLLGLLALLTALYKYRDAESVNT